jgi:hypothetical protein
LLKQLVKVFLAASKTWPQESKIIGCFADPSCNPEKSIQFAENGAAFAENCAAYAQECGVGGCLDQARGVAVDGAGKILKDLKESDDKRKGEITGSVAAYLSPGLIFKGLKWLRRLGEGLEVVAPSVKAEEAVPKSSRLDLLNKQFASLEQIGEEGTIIAGGNARHAFRNAEKGGRVGVTQMGVNIQN